MTGPVNEELLLRNEYLAAENQILRARLPKLALTNPERATRAEIAKRLGRKALAKIATIARPLTFSASGATVQRGGEFPGYKAEARLT